MKLLELHPEAVEEVDEALRFYGERTADGIADDLKGRINSALDDIARWPRRHPYWQKTRYQRCVLSRFPYVIIYEEEPARLHVLAVAHTSRRPGYWRSRLTGD